MKMKIKKILVIIILVTLFVSVGVTYENYAISGKDVTGFIDGDASAPGTDASKKILNTILGLVRVAGAGIAVVMLMTIAAKYIIASSGDRADIKKYAINYIIGAIILLGATGILGVVQGFVNNSLKYGE